MKSIKNYKDDKLDLTNEENRRKHILENMLYYGELNELNVSIYKKVINQNNKYKNTRYNNNI